MMFQYNLRSCTHKHLGVYLSQHCDWQTHIYFIKEKAWSRLNLLRNAKINNQLEIS